MDKGQDPHSPPIMVLVIGPRDHSEEICRLAEKEFPSLQCESHTYENEVDAAHLFEQSWRHFNVALFTGPAPYYIAVDAVGQPIPAVYVPFTGASLYRALFEIVSTTGTVPPLSIDSVDLPGVETTLSELGLESVTHRVLEYQDVPSRESILRFHMNTLEKDKDTFVLTGLRSAYEDLKRNGCRVIRIAPPRTTWLGTLLRAQELGELWFAKRHQLVVGLIEPGEDERKERVPGRGGMHSDLTRIARALDTKLVSLEGGRILFFTNRGILEDQLLPEQGGVFNRLNTALTGENRMKVGIGIGMTGNQAYDHAVLALDRSRLPDSEGVFLVTDAKQLIGPLGGRFQAHHSIRSTSPRIALLADQCGLSMTQMERVLSALARMESLEFSANDIAPYLQMTIRNTRRILSKLESASFVQNTGSERLHPRGRPRKVYLNSLESDGDHQ